MKRTVVLAWLMGLKLGCTACAIGPREADSTGGPVFYDLPTTDFVEVARVVAFYPCAGQTQCRTLPLMELETERQYVGVRTSRFFEGSAEEHLRWWAQGRPLKVLAIGANGPRPGWTSPRDLGATLAYQQCGLTTEDSIASASNVGNVYVWDEEDGTVIDHQFIGSMWRRFADGGVDQDGFPMPDAIGRRSYAYGFEQGQVFTREQVEAGLAQAAQQDVERHLYDETYLIGTCVVPEQDAGP